MTFCRYCGKEIHEAAPNCPNCGRDQSTQVTAVSGLAADGQLWLPITSLVFGIVGLLAFGGGDPQKDKEAFIGIGLFALVGLVFGIVTISKQKTGKGMAIAGVVLSSVALLALLGLSA